MKPIKRYRKHQLVVMQRRWVRKPDLSNVVQLPARPQCLCHGRAA